MLLATCLGHGAAPATPGPRGASNEGLWVEVLRGQAAVSVTLGEYEQKVLSAQPTTNNSPQMVENQCGSSDITQSTVANEITRTYITIVGPENLVAIPSHFAASS